MIYYDGCSWTEGAKSTRRFCDIIGKPYTNKATGGSSNQRIVRHLQEEDMSQYELAIIQMTLPSRTEYYDSKFPRSERGWVKVNFQQTDKPYGEHRRHKYWTEDDYNYWKHHYEHVYTDELGHLIERTHYDFIRSYVKIPLILMTINPKTELSFDIHLDRMDLPKYDGLHPDAEGHDIIARVICTFM